jgi:hypothetical protein
MRVPYETKEYFAASITIIIIIFMALTSLCWALPLPEILIDGSLHTFDIRPAAASYNS